MINGSSLFKNDESGHLSTLNESALETSSMPDLLRNVRSLKEKVSRLGTVRSTTDEILHRLACATDDYTKLLARRPTLEDSGAEDSVSFMNTSMKADADLMEDDGVRFALDRLTRRLAELETRPDAPLKYGVDRSTSMGYLTLQGALTWIRDAKNQATILGGGIFPPKEEKENPSPQDAPMESNSNSATNAPRPPIVISGANIKGGPTGASFSSTGHHISDVEKSRAAIVATLPFMDALNLYDLQLHHSHKVDYMRDDTRDNSGRRSRAKKRDEHSRQLSRSGILDNDGQLNRTAGSLSSAASSLKPLNDAQMTKLKQLQESLRKEIMLSHEQFGASAAKRLADLEDKRGSVCPEETAASRRSKIVVPPLSLPLDDGKKQQRSYTRDLHGKTPAKQVHATQTSFGLWKRDMADKGIQTKVVKRLSRRPSSVPSSPMQSSIGGFLIRRPPPFVSCKSAGQSHSILVNIQQFLALLKVRNPHLYQACQRLDQSDLSVKTLISIFHRELGQLLSKRETELKELLIEYDSVSTAVKSDTSTNEDRVRLKKRMKKLAQVMEMKDTDVERLKKQLSLMVRIRDDVLAEQHRRPCDVLQGLAGVALMTGTSPHQVQHFAKPTASALLRTGWPKSRPNSANRTRKENVQTLRGVRMLSSYLDTC